jgi:hypothetical protein
MTRSLLGLAIVGLLTASQAHGQNYGRNLIGTLHDQTNSSGFTAQRLRSDIYNRSVPRYQFSQVNRGLFNSALTGRPLQKSAKPFSNAGGGGSVSPWLALSEPFTSTASNYYTHVRPQLEQQRINQQIAQRNMQLQRQLQSLNTVPPYSPTGDASKAPTGHAAAFFNYGGYYQPVQPSK